MTSTAYNDDRPETGPIESKVWASLIGAGSGTVISTVVLWALGAGFWTGDWSNEGADNAVLAVPSPLSGFLLLLITAGLTFLGGFMAKHTPRVDKDALATLGGPTDPMPEGGLGLPANLQPRPATVSRRSSELASLDDEGFPPAA